MLTFLDKALLINTLSATGYGGRLTGATEYSVCYFHMVAAYNFHMVTIGRIVLLFMWGPDETKVGRVCSWNGEHLNQITLQKGSDVLHTSVYRYPETNQ